MSGKVYEKRAQLETRSPLTLVTTLEVDDIPTVELAMTYDDGSKKKVKVPTHDLESVEQVFYCFHEFLEAAKKLALDGAEWFEFYRDTLRGHARSAWDLLSSDVNEGIRTEETFRTTFRAFVATIVDETAHRTLMEYLRATVKPRTMSVMELSRRVQILCLYANDLPTESGTPPPAISDEERKTMFYNMMPEDWKTTFTRSNLRVSGMSITQMTIYFNSLCALESAKNKGTHTGKRGRDNNSNDTNTRNNRYRGSNNSGGRNYGNGDSRNGNRGYNNDRNSGGRNSGNRGGRGRGGRGGRGRGNGNRPQGDDTCPVHGGHKWKECFLNPYGDNYRPRNGNGNGQGRGNGSRRGDSYHTNTNDSNGGNTNGGQGNGSNNNNSNTSNTNDSDRRNGNNNTNNRNSNDHYLADIGVPDWNQE